MDIITKDILYIILLHTDKLINISINTSIYKMMQIIFSDKQFWIEKLNYYDIVNILTINGAWISHYYHKHNIDLQIISFKQVRDLRIGQYVIINGRPCKLINMAQTMD